MSQNRSRKSVAQARAAVEQAERVLDTRCASWEKRHAGQRAAALIGGGFLGGFALAILPVKTWTRIGAAIAGTSAWLARSSLTPTLFGVVVGALRAPRAGRPRDDHG
jgi:hypothetical protein